MPMEVGGLCINKIQVFDIDQGGLQNERVYEWSFTCPDQAQTDTNVFQSQGLVLKENGISVTLQRKEGQVWQFEMEADEMATSFSFMFEMHESLTWAQPQSDFLQLYTLVHKTLAIPMTGTLTQDGITHTCNNNCLLSEDSFKAHMRYPTKLFFALIQTYLPDGRSLGISLGDGIGTHQQYKLSNDDFLTLDGKIYKLDTTRLLEDGNKLYFESVAREIDNVTARCRLEYKPSFQQPLYIYLVFIFVKQEASYGSFSGFCEVKQEGEWLKIQIQEAWGFYEHAHLRW